MERLDNRQNDHVRLIFCGLLVLLWIVIAIQWQEKIMMEPDLWWHIKTGEWIWTQGAFPTVDSFSHSFADQPWIAKEWLSQILYFAAYSAAGWNGVMVLALLAVGAGACTLYWLLTRDLHPLYAALACVVALMLASPSLTVRPHLLTLALFIFWTHELFAASGRRAAPPFVLLLLLVVWANLHAAFTIGFVIAFFAFLDFIERTRFSDRDTLLKWLAFLALCPLVTLIHPYSWQAIYATWTVVGPNEAVPLISEWRPFNAQTDIVLHGALLGLIFLPLATGFRLGIAKSLLVVLLLHLFMTHLRYGYFLFPLLPVLAAPEIARQFPRASAAQWRTQPRDALEQAASRHFRPLVAAVAGMIILLASLQATVLRAAPEEDVAITAAISYAKSNGITGNVMNHYNFGGQLIFNGIPTFIDGRNDQLFLGGFTEKFARGPEDAEALARALEEHDIGWTLFPPEDARVALLDRLAGWRRVYSDAHAVIHLRGAAD